MNASGSRLTSPFSNIVFFAAVAAFILVSAKRAFAAHQAAGGPAVALVEMAPSLPQTLMGAGSIALFAGLLGFGMSLALRTRQSRVSSRTLGSRQSRMLCGTVLDNMSQGLCMFDARQRLMISNNRFCELFGIPPGKIVSGMPETELMRLSQGLRFGDEGNTEGTGEAGVLRRVDGNIISVSRRRMADGGEVVTYEDITEQRRAEARILHMARHDALTDLPNRLLFHEDLEQALKRAGTRENIALLLLDIDNFNAVNDTLGHPMGDALLKAIALRLGDAVRETDILARLGGDEFAIVQTRVAQPCNATALAIRLIDAMGAPFDVEGHRIIVATSIGIALAPGDGTDSHLLLKKADMALSRAKADGRGKHRYFEPAMNLRMQIRRTLETDLRNAIEREEFELFYQPVVDVGTEEIVCFEALLRWNHPERGLVQPDEFVSLAEETGLIVPIGEWAIGKACEEAARWPGVVKVAVNLSPVQFKSRKLVPAVRAALAASGLAPGRLELEITESLLLHDNSNTMSVLHQLHGIGVRISMDDFGTGYSSLSYLRKFPFDKIKIDRCFIREISDRDDSLAIIRAVSAIGVSLGMVTTAEGVETREQFERVKSEGCKQVQGYLFGLPRPARDVARLLVKKSGRMPRGKRRPLAANVGAPPVLLAAVAVGAQ